MKRLNFYIDGFNLYFGMVEAGFKMYKWLDIQLLAENLKLANHSIQSVKYFTSRISNNPEKQKKQNTYLDALATTNVQIIYGQFRNQISTCSYCNSKWFDSKEKMTDVNIATYLLRDAYLDNFDEAIVISGDSDLVPPIKAVLEIFPIKSIRVAFPPNRQSNELRQVSSGSFSIGKGKLANSQFQDKILSKYGVELKRPDDWR